MVITRIAPSPSKAEGKSKSGLHLGNVRTALFCYLYAAQQKGSFLYRVENTDQARCSDTGANDILEELKWLGLTPSRGYGTNDKPAEYYTQMERLPIYQKYVDQLLSEGKAYKCYCSSDDLDKARQEAFAKNPKVPYKYPGTCRDMKNLPDKGYVIRLRAPNDGVIEFNDLSFGKMTVPNKENYDFVICRQNGVPLFSFCNAIDDFFIDKVSHVIRGRDHLLNTPHQILIGKSLGFEDFPTYVHLPMMLGSNGSKLSKRDGAVSVREFREAGYAPKAILNYLSRFGWSMGDKEIFSMSEMIDNFDLNRISKSDGKFDYKKFAVINYEHLKSEALLPDAEYAKHLKPFIDAKNIGRFSETDLIPFIKAIRSRGKTFVDSANLMAPLLKFNPAKDELIKDLRQRSPLPFLNDVCVEFSSTENWNEDSIRERVKSFLDKRNLSLKDVGPALRIALLGQKDSPEIFCVLDTLGKHEALRRITSTILLLKD